MISEQQFREIFPRADSKLLNPLNKCMEKYGIKGADMVSFLSTLSHESAGLTVWTENLNYSVEGLMKTFKKYFPNESIAKLYARNPKLIANRVYASRMGNGDEKSGDGWKYRGRGPIQITGKDNYRQIGNGIEKDLLNNPDLLINKEIGIEASCYWYKINVLDKIG